MLFSNMWNWNRTSCCFSFIAENLKTSLSSKACSPLSSSQDSDIDSVFPASPAVEATSFSEPSPENPEGSEGSWSDSFALQSPPDTSNDIDFKVLTLVSIMHLAHTILESYKNRLHIKWLKYGCSIALYRCNAFPLL